MVSSKGTTHSAIVNVINGSAWLKAHEIFSFPSGGMHNCSQEKFPKEEFGNFL